MCPISIGLPEGAVFLHFWLGEIGAFPKMNHDLWGLVVMFQHIILCWLS